MRQPNYLFYPTILDSFQSFLDSEKNWELFYGGSENPKYSVEEYEAMQRQELIDRINRVPFESEAADRGTAFNEVVDCLILNKNTERKDMEIYSNKEEGIIQVDFRERTFIYPISLCREFAEYFRGAIPQVRTEGVLHTKYGSILLYGYIDELMPLSIHDIKTTSRYNAFKFRDHWQHIVYPYCLHQEGSKITLFEYNVVKWGSTNETFTEPYNFNPSRDTERLINHCERFIEFLENNRDQITDKKIFNQLQNE